MWAGYKLKKMDDDSPQLAKPNQYVGPAPTNDEDTNEIDPMAQPDAAPAVPSALVKSRGMPRQLPTAHDLAGKFTTPDKDTGVGHTGKNTFDHMGRRVMVKKPFTAANNAAPNAGDF